MESVTEKMMMSSDSGQSSEKIGQADSVRSALAELVRVIELMDPPDVGYIYDQTEAECVGCQKKAATRAEVVHDPDCLQLAMQNARAALGVEE